MNWTPIKEEYPADYKTVLVTALDERGDADINMGVHIKGEWLILDTYEKRKVVAWIPFPSLYIEEAVITEDREYTLDEAKERMGELTDNEIYQQAETAWEFVETCWENGYPAEFGRIKRARDDNREVFRA